MKKKPKKKVWVLVERAMNGKPISWLSDYDFYDNEGSSWLLQPSCVFKFDWRVKKFLSKTRAELVVSVLNQQVDEEGGQSNYAVEEL